MSGQASGTRFNTIAIHAGTQASASGPEPLGGSGWPGGAEPVDALRLFGSHGSGPQQTLEERVAALEGGSAALVVASGQAARLVVCHTLMSPGDEIVLSRPWLGSPSTPFENSRSFGWRAKWANLAEPESFVEALSDKTKAILVDSISGVDGIAADLEAIARVAQRARVPLIVDNSQATPFLMRPLEHGADAVLYSSTRFLGGPGSTAGLIVDGGTFDWTNDARYPALTQPFEDRGDLVIAEAFGNFAFAVACRVFGLRDLGAAASPLDAATTMHGIETLPLRMQRHCENALAVAHHLKTHPAVTGVRYAGLPEDRTAQRHLSNGGGAILAFTLAGGDEAVRRLMRRLRLFTPLAEVGETRSQIGSANGASGSVLASIGLEDKADIIADLDQALAG